ncbi:unnamed protein product, partial [Vitis vinifera]
MCSICSFNMLCLLPKNIIKRKKILQKIIFSWLILL